jgi:histidinol-phosphate aminotransferase
VSRAPAPRPGVREVEPYVSPQPQATVRLNANECPRPLPAGFSEDLARAVLALPLNRYPDGQMTRLREDLAVHVGHPFEGTWAANGSNEILTELLLAYGGPGRTTLVFEPTYLLHSRLAALTSTALVSLRLDDPFVITDRAIDLAAAADPDIVFICSPNNPTGNAQPLAATRAIADTVDTLVIVDEAYVEFGGQTALTLVADHPNVVVTRTLSKAFALAGARIGYCLAAPEVVQDLQRVRLPYHMSALTQAAGIAALRHAPEALAILDAIRAQRERLAKTLGGMRGVTVYPSDANFVLFTPPSGRDATEVWRALLERDVLVRDLSTVVPRALRVTAGTEDETSQFLDALTEVLT